MTLTQWYYHFVHKMPCRVVHYLCSLCREEGLCPHCIEKFWKIEDRYKGPDVVVTSLPKGYMAVGPNNGTFTANGNSTITIVKTF